MIALFRPIALGGVTLAALGFGALSLAARENPADVEQEPGLTTPVETVASVPSEPGPDAIRVRPLIDGEPRILNLPIPAGTVIRQGDLIAELDPTGLKDALAEQLVDKERAIANHQNAIRELEVAEIDLEEYLEATFPWQLREAEEGLAIAQADLELAELRLEAREREAAPADGRAIAQAGLEPERGFPDLLGREAEIDDDLAIRSAEIMVRRAKLVRDKADRELWLLTNLTKAREVSERKWAIERTKAEVFTRKSSVDLEQMKEERLRRMIADCTVLAPAAGTVRYPEGVAEGGALKRGQVLLWIEPLPGD